IDSAAAGDVRISGGNLLGRWARQLAGGDRVQVKGYFDNTEREIPGTFEERLNIFDVEFQHALHVGSRHSVIWGGGYRRADDHVSNTAAIAFLPADRNLRWGNLFVQDEIALAGDRKGDGRKDERDRSLGKLAGGRKVAAQRRPAGAGPKPASQTWQRRYDGRRRCRK